MNETEHLEMRGRVDESTDYSILPQSAINETSINLTATANDENITARDENLAKIEIALLAVIFIITLVGNLIVLMGIYWSRQKMTRMYYFILHLTMADLITGFFTVLSQLFWEITYRFQGGNILCKVIKYLQLLGPYSSSYVLVVTALDRYLAICHPLTNSSWTAYQSKWMLGVAWGLSFLCCIPQVFIFSYQMVPNHKVYDCWGVFIPGGEKIYVTWYCISVFIVPLVVLIFSYTCITKTIWQNFSQKVGNRGKRKRSKCFRGKMCRFSRKRCSSHSPSFTLCDQLERQQDVETRSCSHSCGRSIQDDDYFQGYRSNLSSCRSRTSTASELEAPQSSVNLANKASHLDRRRESNLTYASDASEDPNIRSKTVSRGSREIDSKSFLQFDFQTRSRRTSDEEKKLLTRPLRKRSVPTYSSSLFRDRSCQLPASRALQDRRKTGSFLEARSNNSTSRMPSPNIEVQPRVNTVEGISRAKIKTIKLTITVILCYIMCSSPFIGAQLWYSWDPNAIQSPFYSGVTFTILTLLASLNSCVNPWIFLFFNPNLIQNFKDVMCRNRQRNSASSRTPPSQFSHSNVLVQINDGMSSRNRSAIAKTKSAPISNTSLTLVNASPIMREKNVLISQDSPSQVTNV